MTSSILRTNVLSNFTCLGDKCEDTCCQNWSMQMDEATLERYRKEAPELLDVVVSDDDGTPIMRKNPATGFCVKLDGGWCGIHKTHGGNFLGDACYFYPRVTRKLGDQVVMTATMSCPEIVRLALADEQAGAMAEASAERLPQRLKNYLSEGAAPADALAIHRAFVEAAEDKEAPPERIFLRIASASRSLERIDKKNWPAMAAFYLKNADARIPPADANPADPFNLLHALCGLIVASHKPLSPRLSRTVGDMEKALAVTLDWQQALIHTGDHSLASYQQLQAMWQDGAAVHYTLLLRRWLQMQMSLALWPYAGLGSTLSERITIIGVRLATLKLALMCAHHIYGNALPPDEMVRVTQSLSRFLDHLGDPGFSLQIYTETGWINETRMRGLLEI